MIKRGISLLAAATVFLAACTGTGSTPAPTTAPTTAPSAGSGSAAPSAAASATPIAGGLLDKVLKAGKLIVSTDPNYAPQSVPEAGRHRTRASTSTSPTRSASGSASRSSS